MFKRRVFRAFVSRTILYIFDHNDFMQCSTAYSNVGYSF